MKKIVKIAVAVMAIFAMTNFIACSTGGDSEGNTETEAGTGGSTGGTTGGETGGSTGGTTGGETGGSTGGTTGGETGGSTGEVKPVAGEYKVVYGDVVIADGLTMEAATAMATKYGLVETTDYSIDTANKKIILTAAGMAKVEAAGGEGDHDHTGEGGEGGETGGTTGGTTGGETGGTGGSTGEVKPVAGEYKVVYGDITIAKDLTLEAANAMATEFGLIENTDYTINNETKTITLTASGMAKVEAAESGNPGAGDEPSGPGAGTEKLNLTVDITTLTFAEATAGLTDTAAPDKNGTYMIPTTAKILDALTPTKDDKAFWYTNKARNKISALQLNADGELAFVLTNPATVKVTFLSTDNTKTSAITINGTQNSVTGKTAQEFTWEIAAAGNYTIASTGTSNARITAISIVEK